MNLARQHYVRMMMYTHFYSHVYTCHMLLLLVCMPFPGLKIDRSFGSFLLSCANDGCSLLETSVMLPALVGLGHRELVPPRFRVLSSE